MVKWPAEWGARQQIARLHQADGHAAGLVVIDDVQVQTTARMAGVQSAVTFSTGQIKDCKCPSSVRPHLQYSMAWGVVG
jgi:hypothetical protein